MRQFACSDVPMHVQHVEQTIAVLILELLHLRKVVRNPIQTAVGWSVGLSQYCHGEVDHPLCMSTREYSMPDQPAGTGPVIIALGSTFFTAVAHLRLRFHM